MNILLIGEAYSENLGDGIICETVANLIHKEYPDCTIVVADISGKKGYADNQNKKKLHTKLFSLNRHFHPVVEYPLYLLLNSSKNKKNYIQEICSDDYDIALFAGGQLLFNHFIIPISRYVKTLDKKGTPVVFHSCGMGKIKSRQLKILLRKALLRKNVVSVSMRDNLKAFQNEIMKENELSVQQTYDTALWSSEAYGIRKKESKCIGLGIMSLPGQKKKLIKFWMNVITELDRYNLKWQLFCNGDPADDELAKEIALLYRQAQTLKDTDIIASRPMTGKELIQLISNYQTILSFRLHSHIVACSLQIPSLAVSWDKKVSHFFQIIGYPQRVVTPQDSILEIVQQLKRISKEGYDDVKIQLQKQTVLYHLYNNIETALDIGLNSTPSEKERDELLS